MTCMLAQEGTIEMTRTVEHELGTLKVGERIDVVSIHVQSGIAELIGQRLDEFYLPADSFRILNKAPGASGPHN